MERLYKWELRFAFTLILLRTLAIAGGPESYRFPEEPGSTQDGYPLPLTGQPLRKTPLIAKEGTSVREYPEHYIPGQESLAEDEMRIVSCGS